MAISRKVADPAGVTNASGEPEITVSVGELTLSAMPPKPATRKPVPPTPAGAPEHGNEVTPDR